jgi:hypothetical protein
MKNVVCVVALALSLGCTTAVVRPYVGEQPIWPTAGGSVINTRYELPIFTTLPSAPYTVLAELRLESPFYATPEPGQMPVLVEKAREIGADAIALVEPRSFFTTSAAPKPTPGKAVPATATTTMVNNFNPEAFKGSVAVVAIRWIGAAPEGMPAKFVRKPSTATTTTAVVKVETKPVEAVIEPKVPSKTNFGPLRPAKEQKRGVTSPAPAPAPATAPAAESDPRKAPTQ